MFLLDQFLEAGCLLTEETWHLTATDKLLSKEAAPISTDTQCVIDKSD